MRPLSLLRVAQFAVGVAEHLCSRRRTERSSLPKYASADAFAEAGALKPGAAKVILGSARRLGNAMLQVWRAASQAAREMAAGRLGELGAGAAPL